MEKTALHTKDYHVGINDVDFSRKLKLSALFNYFQESAKLAAEVLGLGMDIMEKEHGAAWIIARIRVDLERRPDWDDTITITTWPQPPGRLEFERDYLVKDKEGKVIAKAVSSWILMDIKRRRIRRADSITIDYPLVERPRPIDCELGKLQPPGELVDVYSRMIGYGDIDVYGHLNNTKYVDFIMDCFSMESHRQLNFTSLEVSFVNEALPGDSIILRREEELQETGQLYIEGVRESDGRVVFRAQLGVAEG